MADQQLTSVADDDRLPADVAVDDAPQPRAVPKWRRGRDLQDGSRLYWFKELAVGLGIYLVYESVRNVSKGKPSTAFDNAMRVMDWQRALGINHEKAIQDWALNWLPIIVISNYYYGIAYIACTIFILIWLYRGQSDDYPLWRNTLAFGTLLGLIGFATFPLMPPRLLDVMGDGQYFGFVDTLVKYPTFWSFDSGTFKNISNQYAAMPSMHIGWSVWAMLVLLPLVRRAWAKGLIILHPLATLFCILVTANHYWIDGLGGLVTLAFGFLLARALTRFWERRASAAAPPPDSSAPDGPTVVSGVTEERLLPAGPPADT